MWRGKTLITAIKRLRNEDGQTLVEYSLIIGLLVVVVVAAIYLLGSHVGNPENNAVLANALGG